jgi:hypothetical protein
MLDRSLEAIATSEPCVIDHCGDFGVDIHHRKQRSEGGDDRRANLCHICRRHHDWVHEHLDRAHELGLIIWGYEDDPKVIIKRVRISLSILLFLATDSPSSRTVSSGFYIFVNKKNKAVHNKYRKADTLGISAEIADKYSY